MLEKEREKIDILDKEIIDLLNKRMEVSGIIAKEKMKNNMPIYDLARENIILNNESINNSKYSESIKNIYKEIFSQSKKLQSAISKGEVEYALFGENLFYSISKDIHMYANNKKYRHVQCKNIDDIIKYITTEKFKGANITNPFKKQILSRLDIVDSVGQEIGSVNTIIKKGSKFKGYNTDVQGFMATLRKNNVIVEDRAFLILGTGATSQMVKKVLLKMKASCVLTIGRSSEINYSNYQDKLRDFEFSYVINATPVGNVLHDYALIDLKYLHINDGVLDLNYFPFYSKLLIQAKKCGLKAINGLYMLFVQGVESEKIFQGVDSILVDMEGVYELVGKQILNITLIGMPGAGKTTIGKKLAEKMSKEFYDIDEIIEKIMSMSVVDIFTNLGESFFRNLENFVLENIIRLKKGAVIATGGGIVENNRNREIISQNSFVVNLESNVEVSKNHQILQYHSYDDLLKKRKNFYDEISNLTINSNEENFDIMYNKIEVEFSRFLKANG